MTLPKALGGEDYLKTLQMAAEPFSINHAVLDRDTWLQTPELNKLTPLWEGREWTLVSIAP